MGKRTPHWTARALDYEALAKGMRNPEVRQVLDHLARICREMGKGEAKSVTASELELSWLDSFTRAREATAMRWRIRESEYRAMAENSGNAHAQASWLTVARRCAELAHYIERTALPVQGSARFAPERRDARLRRSEA